MEPLQAIDGFISEQIQSWETARINYAGLSEVKLKTIPFQGYDIRVQFNPKRIISSAAKIDPKSIEARPCFLCAGNRPKEQRALKFKNKYLILVNPFPIFPKHLTIPLEDHSDQLIAGRISDMLELAQALPDFVIFYNGPKCGASAPDHFHFQAGSKGFMPIENDFRKEDLLHSSCLSEKMQVYTWKNYLRGVISVISNDLNILSAYFEQCYTRLAKLQPQEREPMLNILCYRENDKWILHIFPRILHRPAQYFLGGSEQILISPASVDMGGAFITPREEDFDKITDQDIADILNQVCMDDKQLNNLIQ